MDSYNLTCADILLGNPASADEESTLLLPSGAHSVASLARGNAGDAENKVTLGTSVVTLSGTMNGTGIVFTNTSGSISGGTLTNVNCGGTNTLLAYTSVDGGGNTNVDFSAPGGIIPVV